MSIDKYIASVIRSAMQFQEDIASLRKITGLDEEKIKRIIRESPYSASQLRTYYLEYGKFPNYIQNG